MRRLVALIAALSLMAFAGTAAAGKRGGPPPFPRFVGVWTHAEINVTIKRHQHTLILDRGRIVQSSPRQLTLSESDGTTELVTIGPDTIFTGVHLRKRLPRRPLYAETMRIDTLTGDAVRVRVTPRP